MKKQVFVDMMASVVDRTNEILEGSITANYMYGHFSEILETLIEKSRSTTYRNQRFPIVLLLQDFREEENDYLVDITCRVLLMTDTDPKFKAADRYEMTFAQTLYPLYDAFKQALEESPHFHQYLFNVDATDRLYFGKNGIYGNTSNTANDFIDAIEIENLRLTIRKTC